MAVKHLKHEASDANPSVSSTTGHIQSVSTGCFNNFFLSASLFFSENLIIENSGVNFSKKISEFFRATDAL